MPWGVTSSPYFVSSHCSTLFLLRHQSAAEISPARLVAVPSLGSAGMAKIVSPGNFSGVSDWY